MRLLNTAILMTCLSALLCGCAGDSDLPADAEKNRLTPTEEQIVISQKENVPRYPAYDPQDLADALNHDMLAAAYLDVLEQEPMSPDTPLKNAKNCAITPHIGWTPLEARRRLLDITEDNLRGWLCGNPQHVVNKL